MKQRLLQILISMFIIGCISIAYYFTIQGIKGLTQSNIDKIYQPKIDSLQLKITELQLKITEVELTSEKYRHEAIKRDIDILKLLR